MLVREFTYKDFNGVERKETFCFNLSRADLWEMELGAYGGLDDMMRRLIQEKRPKDVVEIFKNIILSAVGRKSPDGRRFERSPEIREDFYQTNAYNQLFVELVSDPQKMHDWLLQTVEDDVREGMLANEANAEADDGVQLTMLPGAGGQSADN